MLTMERIALMGAGSLGTILGAYIAKARQIDLIDANAEHVAALNRNGATVIGQVRMNVRVTALTPDEMDGQYDLVIYLVKQLVNKEALRALKPHLHGESVVCTLQNGFPEIELAKELGERRVMGCAVNWGATWVGPGVSELTSDKEHMSFHLGRLDGRITPEVKQVQEILSLMCRTEITGGLREARWAKLVTNASFSGMSAALGCAFGDILDSDRPFVFLQYLINEIIRVGEAMGITRLPYGNADAMASLRFSSDAERRQKAPLYQSSWGPHRLLRASMLQDLEKGRKCEIDAINGVVSGQGREHGVGTPFCDAVIRVVRDIEAGTRSPSMDNFAELEAVLETHRYER